MEFLEVSLKTLRNLNPLLVPSYFVVRFLQVEHLSLILSAGLIISYSETVESFRSLSSFGRHVSPR